MALSVNIRKKLGKFELDVCFEAKDEILALLGASGCGKSMTLKCIAGIETPDEGCITLDGRVLFDSQKRINLTPQQRRAGYLFQQYALFPNMTVTQNIVAGAHQKERRERKKVVEEKIRLLRLEGLENKRPEALSGGQQQRVALARILASEPQTILLDEPFSALDSYLKWQLEMELAGALEQFKGTIIWVSHDRNEVYRNCERVCVLQNGQSEKIISLDTLMSRPETLAAALLSGCKNYSPIEKMIHDKLYIPEWGVELSVAGPWNGEQYVGIYAHDLHLGGVINAFECDVIRASEDVQSVMVLLHPKKAATDVQLLMRLDKKTWGMNRHLDCVSVGVAPESILFLR